MHRNRPKGAQLLKETSRTKDGTVVDDVTGLLLRAIRRYSEHLHFHQRVHNGGLLVIHFWELLC